jgi:adenylyltransferase/sulfurtransferase
MSIKVHIGPLLSQYTDNQGIAEVNGDTVGQCLDHLVKQFPRIKKALFHDNGELLNYIEVYVNEESSYPEELTKPVKPGDELHILFMIDGG